MLHVPNGVLLDVGRRWGAGQFTWIPAKITAPALMVMGEWDHDTPPSRPHTVFPLLTHAPWKPFTMIGEATHTASMEKNCQQLFTLMRDVLREPAPKDGKPGAGE